MKQKDVTRGNFNHSEKSEGEDKYLFIRIYGSHVFSFL